MIVATYRRVVTTVLLVIKVFDYISNSWIRSYYILHRINISKNYYLLPEHHVHLTHRMLKMSTATVDVALA